MLKVVPLRKPLSIYPESDLIAYMLPFPLIQRSHGKGPRYDVVKTVAPVVSYLYVDSESLRGVPVDAARN